MSTDPYVSLLSLADGWEARAQDLITRAEGMTDRAVEGRAGLAGTERLAQADPTTLLTAARHNRATANGLSSCAAELRDAIDFARRHVLDPS